MEYNPQPSRRFTQDRIQTLLNTCDEPYVNRDVQVEGAFIQISDDSSPMRQVFLAITKAEFIIVKQETHVDLENGCHGDEVSDLSIDEIIPLPMLHFFIIDNRAKRFAACTSLGKLYHFEMCLLDFYSDQLWTKWRCVMDNFSGSENGDFAAKRFRVSYVVKIDEKYHKQFEMLRCKLGVPGPKTLQFIHHPVAFKRVESRGTQTRDVDSNSVKKFDAVRVINKQNNKAFLKSEISTPITSYSSESCVVDYKDGSVSPKNNILTYKSNDPSNRPIEIGHLLRVRQKYVYTGNEIWRENFTIGNAPLEKSNSDGFISMVTSEVDKKSPTCSDPSSDIELQKFRDRFGKAREKKYGDPTSNVCLVGDVDSCSESEDEDVDKFFDKVHQIKQKTDERNGRFLWLLAKRLVLKKDVAEFKTNITDVVKEAKFRKLINSQVPLPASLTDLDPLDVSHHLTHASRRLFLLIAPQDIEMVTWSKGHKLPKSIMDVLEFHDVIVRMVVTEILQNTDGKGGQIRALKFFIQVSVNLYLRHHDYQSLTAILKGLTSLPLYHKHNLWATLFIQEPFSFCHFMTMVKILSPDKQYRGYVARVKTCSTRGDSFIPWMDHILQHCFTRLSDEPISVPSLQPFKKVSYLSRFFDNKAKSMNPSKTEIKVTNAEKSSISKSILTFGKMKSWTFKAKRDQNKAQRKVRFEENAEDVLSSKNNEDMKHRAKATWFKRRKSIDDLEEQEADEDTVIHEKDISDEGAAVPGVEMYSDFKAHDVLTDAVSEATGTQDADAEANTGTEINTTIREEGDAVDVENVKCKVNNDSSAASTTTWTVPRMTFSLKSKRKHGTAAKKEKQPHIELPPTKEIMIVAEACTEEENVGACDDTKDENGSGKVNERQQSQTSNQETETRISYAPAAATSTRRKSLFEEAAEKHATQEEINEAFEALKATRRSETDARKSALDMIKEDDDFHYSTGISDNKHAKKSIVRSILNMFRSKENDSTNRKVKNLNGNAGCGKESVYTTSRNVDLRTVKDPSVVPQAVKQNSWKAGKMYNDFTNMNQNNSEIQSNHKFTKSVSQDRLGFLYCSRHINNCSLCANKECIYGEQIRTQVTKYQTNLLNMETHSRCRVKEYLKLVMDVYDCRSNVDVLKLSFQSN